MTETDSDRTVLRKLQGGDQWHSPDVDCRYVSTTELGFDEETHVVEWDESERTLQVRDGPESTITIADVCNHCRQALGWHAPWITPTEPDD